MSNNPLDIAAFRCVESVGFAFGALSLKTLCFPHGFQRITEFWKKLQNLWNFFPPADTTVSVVLAFLGNAKEGYAIRQSS